MYPIGILFGLGFDTATEVALLVLAGSAAYDWAFANPVRKVYYNLTITGLSVFVAVFIGTIEILGLIGQEYHLSGGFWTFLGGFDINKAGFVIVGIFIVTWIAALALWHFGQLEERWGHHAFTEGPAE